VSDSKELKKKPHVFLMVMSQRGNVLTAIKVWMSAVHDVAGFAAMTVAP
jgi:hypothetical protein